MLQFIVLPTRFRVLFRDSQGASDARKKTCGEFEAKIDFGVTIEKAPRGVDGVR
jgi:hypothetical protein